MGLEPFFYFGHPYFGLQATKLSMSTKTEQLQAMIAPAVTALGYELWGVEFHSHSHLPVLRVFIDSENGINVDDCAAASRQISGVLDVEDPISSEYTLEVSSPGMDRPLFTLDQFQRYLGEWIKVKLRAPFEGRRNFRGRLTGVEGDEVIVVVDAHEYLLPIELIDKANVIPQFVSEKSSNEKAGDEKNVKDIGAATVAGDEVVLNEDSLSSEDAADHDDSLEND